MRKQILPLLALFALAVAPHQKVAAQTFDLGLGRYEMTVYDDAGLLTDHTKSFQLYGNFNLPLYGFSKEFSIGMQTGIGAGLSGEDLFFATVPTHLLINYGCDATRKAKKRVGFVAGAGINPLFLNYSGRGLTTVPASAIAEIHYATKNDKLIKLKALFNLTDTFSKSYPNDPSASFNGTLNVKYGWAIYLAYTPNY